MIQADDVGGVFADTASVRAGLAAAGYLADDKIAGVVSLAARLGKPLLIEGPAGTGKTQLAKSVAMMADRPLIRLQCYEGIDESKALYEWDYRKQLLWIQAARGDETFSADAVIETGKGIFDERFLLTRPMLEAIRTTPGTCRRRSSVGACSSILTTRRRSGSGRSWSTRSRASRASSWTGSSAWWRPCAA